MKKPIIITLGVILLTALDVKLAGQGLFISVKTESSNNRNEGVKNQYLKRERVVGTYQRSLTLPGPVKEPAITTNYSNGVLTISIPKA
ncbi:MAG: Hsp20/alpha crystallin family protein [Gammaproteobacteria bacterium]